jgi:CelD/BcsL family acetyltransferase involved in cellulose biosynthesis
MTGSYVPNIEIVSTEADLLALASDWNKLADRDGNPLRRFEWFRASSEALDAGNRLRVVVFRSGSEVRGIAPLVVDGNWPASRLKMLDHFTREASGFLFADGEALSALCAGMLAQRRPIEIRRLREDGPEIEILRSASGFGGLALAPSMNAPTARVDLSVGWEAIERAMSSGSRSIVRRKRRAAERSGEVSVTAVSPNLDTVDAAMADIFRIEGSGWKSRAGTSTLKDTRMQRFLSAYGRDAAREGILRLYFLHIGSDLAAVRMAVEHCGALWEIKIGYDERWAKVSPGMLLTHECLRLAAESGLSGFEFLGVASPWQMHWPVQLTQHRRFYFFPLSIAGMTAFSDTAVTFARTKMNPFRGPKVILDPSQQNPSVVDGTAPSSSSAAAP